MSGNSEKTNVQVVKVLEDLGLAIGFAIVSKIDGEDYYDLNVDREGTRKGERVPEHIPEDEVMKAALDFAKNTEQPGNVMHAGPDVGQHVFIFPLTSEVAKALDIQTRKTGLLVGYHAPPEILAKFKAGEFSGFSIEGSHSGSEEVD